MRSQPFTYPDVDGPVGTIRLEMLREGMQETEAQVCIEAALANGQTTGVPGPDLAARARALLDERAAAMPQNQPGSPKASSAYALTSWQDLSGRLFSLAAEVARVHERK